jgi:Protein of unknown function (DUF1214)
VTFDAGGATPSSTLIDVVLRDVPDSPAVDLDERSMASFCQHLQESARLLADHPLTQNPVDRAEAFRYLLTVIGLAVDSGVLNADPLQPMFSPPYPVLRADWGAANPDGVYRRALLREDRAYRLSGVLGNAKYISFDLRREPRTDTVAREDLVIEPDGSFDAVVGGGERQSENWLPLEPGTTSLTTREFFDDWQAGRRSVLRIECLDGALPPRPEHNSRRMAAAFDLIGEWVQQAGVRYWADRSLGVFPKATNAFLPDLRRGDTKLPAIAQGTWKLAPDEALIIELPDPDAVYWGLQLASSLWHTLEYANHTTSYNRTQAHRDPDGTYRFVLSAADPGVFNWLDTTGLERGIVIVRLHQPTNPIRPRTTLIKSADVTRALPQARMCTAEERRAQVADRRDGVAHLLCD